MKMTSIRNIVLRVFKILSYLLWTIIIGILLMLVVGNLKYEGSIGDYFRYLNNKDWSATMSGFNIFSPSSVTNIFWDNGDGYVMTGMVGTGEVLGTGVLDTGNLFESNELPMSGYDAEMTGSEISGDVNVFDPAFGDDFESFFSGASESGVLQKLDSMGTDSEDFGFNKDLTSTGSNKNK